MPTLNGTGPKPVRKSLATQLDRFDSMLDGLSDAIPDAVATAVRQATAQAVREAVTAVLTNPTILNTLRPEAKPAVESAQESQVSQVAGQVWEGVQNGTAWLRDGCVTSAGKVQTCVGEWYRQGVAYVDGMVQQARHVKHALIALVGIGVTLALFTCR